MFTLTTSIPFGSSSLYIAVCQRVTKVLRATSVSMVGLPHGVRRGSGAAGRHPPCLWWDFVISHPPPLFAAARGGEGGPASSPSLRRCSLQNIAATSAISVKWLIFTSKNRKKIGFFLGKIGFLGGRAQKDGGIGIRLPRVLCNAESSMYF